MIFLKYHTKKEK